VLAMLQLRVPDANAFEFERRLATRLRNPRASRTGARLQHGWDWCRDKILQAARPGCSASASTVMSICARCSSMERAQCFDISNTEPIEPMIGCGVCWPDATTMSLLLRWPTRMLALPGRCSRIIATSRPITCQLLRADKHGARNTASGPTSSETRWSPPHSSIGCYIIAVVIAIEGNSYRLRKHADLVPEHLRSRPIPKVIELPEPKRRRVRPGSPASTVTPSSRVFKDAVEFPNTTAF
jgi:hypothetical protein